MLVFNTKPHFGNEIVCSKISGFHSSVPADSRHVGRKVWIIMCAVRDISKASQSFELSGTTHPTTLCPSLALVPCLYPHSLHLCTQSLVYLTFINSMPFLLLSLDTCYRLSVTHAKYNNYGNRTQSFNIVKTRDCQQTWFWASFIHVPPSWLISVLSS